MILEGYQRRAWAEISLDSLRKNYFNIKSHVNNAKICAVVKANAYGHGVKRVAELYDTLGVSYFAVSNIEEAVELRTVTDTPILILGYTPPECKYLLTKYNITQTVYSLEYAKKLSLNSEKIKVHVKVDTGMGRLGFSYRTQNDVTVEQISEIYSVKQFDIEGIFTHFSVSDSGARGAEFTRMQFELFSDLISRLEERGVKFSIRHAANSGAILAYPEYSLDMVRAGIILYGFYPSDNVTDTFGLKPALTLKSIVSHIKRVGRGESIGYGRCFVADKDMLVATVPIGYADGVMRSSFKSEVKLLIKDTPVKIIGAVCMDQLMVDVTEIADIQIGDEVIVWSDTGSLNAKDFAEKNNTISYEALSLLSRRLPRVYKQGNEILDVEDYIIERHKI